MKYKLLFPKVGDVMFKPVREQFHNHRSGAAAVELALIMPVFLIIVWGIVEFGRGMMVGQLVTNASRHGVRYAVIDGYTNTDVEDEVQTFLVNAVGGITAADVTVTIEVDEAPGNPATGDDITLAHTRDVCRVTASLPYNQVGYVTGQWLAGTNLTGSCSMRRE